MVCVSSDKVSLFPAISFKFKPKNPPRKLEERDKTNQSKEPEMPTSLIIDILLWQIFNF